MTDTDNSRAADTGSSITGVEPGDSRPNDSGSLPPVNTPEQRDRFDGEQRRGWWDRSLD